jgi:sporulation protein YlmC with PRC-barrel domain
LEDQVGWVASIATMLAAMMTAANLGTRVTGYGFVVFTVGSLAWSTMAMLTGQQSLLITNGFLTIVNLVGIWRWLGKQARYETGGEKAARRSWRAPVPTLFSASSMIGAPVHASDGTRLGTIVDAMMRCRGTDISYLVVSDGGVAGIGETLRALSPDEVMFSHAEVRTDLTEYEFRSRHVLQADSWPESLPPSQPERSPAVGATPPAKVAGGA